MISPGLNLVMTVIGFAVSTMFIIFVCTRLICARIQLRASRRSFPTASRFDLSIMERGMHGLEPVLLSSFPTKKFGDQFTSGEDIQCAVCLSEYQEIDVLRVLPYCGHVFHVNCVDIWLKQHTTCPVCRISLRGSPNEKRTLQNSQAASMRTLNPHGNYYSDSYLYQQGGQDFSPRTTSNQRMDQLNSEPSGIDECISALPPVNCSVKVTTNHELGGKYMESPSHSE